MALYKCSSIRKSVLPKYSVFIPVLFMRRFHGLFLLFVIVISLLHVKANPILEHIRVRETLESAVLSTCSRPACNFNLIIPTHQSVYVT